MRVLGVDPGLGRTGVAVVEGHPGALRLVHASCLQTPAGIEDAERLFLLSELVGAVVAEQRPAFAAVERLFFSTNRSTAMRVAEARGVLLCALAAAGIPVAEYTPNEVKESVAGYGASAQTAGAAHDHEPALRRPHRRPRRRRRRLCHRRLPPPSRWTDAAGARTGTGAVTSRLTSRSPQPGRG